LPLIANAHPHHGEEAVISGTGGSGTIFFSQCNLRCVFCQNSGISTASVGRECGPEELAGIMMSLRDSGCHNINLVTPTHVVPWILEAIVRRTGHPTHGTSMIL